MLNAPYPQTVSYTANKRPERVEAGIGFGSGFGPAISHGVETLGKSPLLELFVTDFMGMTGPRSLIEYVKRGSDAGRESLIREILGVTTVVFMTGWLGSLLPRLGLVKFLRPLLNPHRIHPLSWVNAGTMEEFGRIFKNTLHQSSSTQEARKRFIQEVLRGLQASDSHLPKLAIQQFEGNPLLKKVFEKTYEGLPMEGRLSEATVQALEKLFGFHASPWQGLANLDKAVAGQLSGHPAAGAGTLAYAEKRLALSQDIFKVEKHLLAEMERIALEGGLTEQVNLGGAKRKQLAHVLRDLKHFLEQYADRAFAEGAGGSAAGTVRGLNRKAILNRLFAQNKKPWPLRWLPGVQDGLVSFTFKIKRLLVGGALLLSSIATMSVAYLNNWITRMKHGGKVFYPGEEVFVNKIPREQAQEAVANHPSAFQNSASHFALPAVSTGPVFAPPVTSSFAIPSAAPYSMGYNNPARPYLNGLDTSQVSGDARYANAHSNFNVSSRFGNLLTSKAGAFLRGLDYPQLGTSILPYSMIVFSLEGVSRLFAAAERSWNEVHEVSLREILAFTFWFFATPLTQRAFIQWFSPKDVKPILLYKSEKPLQQGFKRFLWSVNPLARWQLATPGQLKNRLAQTLKTAGKIGADAEKTLVNYFTRAKNWRNYAQALGTFNTIVLLGIILPFFNIFRTHHQVEQGKVGRY